MAVTIEKEKLEKQLLELSDTEPKYVSGLLKMLKERIELKQDSEFDEIMHKNFAKYESVFKSDYIPINIRTQK
jgi:hypothetical protein